MINPLTDFHGLDRIQSLLGSQRYLGRGGFVQQLRRWIHYHTAWTVVIEGALEYTTTCLLGINDRNFIFA
jgi:hypothetical protein